MYFTDAKYLYKINSIVQILLSAIVGTDFSLIYFFFITYHIDAEYFDFFVKVKLHVYT